MAPEASHRESALSVTKRRRSTARFKQKHSSFILTNIFFRQSYQNTVFHLQLQALFMPSKKKDIIETFSDFCIHLFRSKCWCQSYKLFYDQLDDLKIIELKTGLFLYLNLQLNAKQFYSE